MNWTKSLPPVLTAFVLAAALFVEPAFAQLIDSADRPSALGTDTYSGSFRQAVLTFINFVLFFLGLVATVFVIYGGFVLITSAGDEGKAGEAKKLVAYAAAGIVMILVSYALVNTLLGAGTGARPV